jgi:hypothetical protein
LLAQLLELPQHQLLEQQELLQMQHQLLLEQQEQQQELLEQQELPLAFRHKQKETKPTKQQLVQIISC